MLDSLSADLAVFVRKTPDRHGMSTGELEGGEVARRAQGDPFFARIALPSRRSIPDGWNLPPVAVDVARRHGFLATTNWWSLRVRYTPR